MIHKLRSTISRLLISLMCGIYIMYIFLQRACIQVLPPSRSSCLLLLPLSLFPCLLPSVFPSLDPALPAASISLPSQAERRGSGASKEKEKQPAKSNEGKKEKGEWASSSESEADSDDETSKILESGGRDKCAYFFWQGR